MEEETVMERIDEILQEYAQLPQMVNYNLSLEAVGDKGDVKVSLAGKSKGGDALIERVIAHNEPLDFITDTFYYPNTFTPRSRLMSLKGLRMAYFDIDGNLIVEHDLSTELFKVNSKQKEEVTLLLKEKLGDKFKA